LFTYDLDANCKVMDIEELEYAIERYRLIMHRAYNLDNNKKDDQFDIFIRELEYLEGTEGVESKKFKKHLKKVANKLSMAINRLEKQNLLVYSEMKEFILETVEFKNINDVIICLIRLTEHFSKNKNI
jgi:hypothetical protein